MTVTVGDLAESAGFYVEDTGPGIPTDERDKIFDDGYTTNQDRTGFGLSIVAEVVDAHGCEIQVTDGSDGGARIEITTSAPPERCIRAYILHTLDRYTKKLSGGGVTDSEDVCSR